MTTPSDIILQALKAAGILGIGQPAGAEDISDAFFQLNMMLAQWSKKRWLVYHLVNVSKVATGAVSYTVGPGGDFNVTRPDKLESAFVRQINISQPVDYPLEILNAREDYNRITLKTLQSFPYYVFLDSGFPTGTLYPWPVPGPNYEVHITVKDTLTQFTSVSQTINLPPEYIGALFYNLGVRLRPLYQLPPEPTLTAMAKDSLGVLRQANVQVPEMTYPPELTHGGRSYNIYSDSY